MALSPGIITNELVSVPTQPLAATTLPVIVGGATKGLVGVPTLCTSESDLLRRFGLPTANDYGLLAAIEFFKLGGQCFFLRVADSSIATARSNVLGPEGNRATGSVTLTGNPVDGDQVTISDGATSKTFEFDKATAPTGSITFTGQPTDADTFVLNDGVNPAITFEYDTAAKAVGTLVLGGQPTDGDQFLIGDGSINVTFEFDSNASVVESGLLRRVVIGATLSDTLTNLFNAVNNAPGFNITALTISGGNTVNLQHDNYGVVGNVAITEPVNVSTFLSDTGMAGGDDLSAAGANVPIAIGASTAETVANTIAAINGVGISLAISAAAGVGTALTLVNDANGAAGNVAITDNINNATVTGMSGGTSAGVVSGNVAVAIGASAAITAQNLRAAVNAQTFNVTASGTGASVLLTNDGVGTGGNVAVTELDSGGNITISGMAGGTANGAVLGLTVSAASPGTWGNSIRVTLSPTTVAGAPAGNFDLSIEAPVGSSTAIQVVETFFNLSPDSSSARFAETVVNTGIVNESNASRYIVVDVLVNQTPVAGVYQIGSALAGADGISGLTAADYIGTASGTAATGMQTLRNSETVSFNLLAVPGVTHTDVVNEMLAICSFRGDAFAVVDPPFGLTPGQVTDWHNGLSTLVPNPPTSPLDSDYGALYWAWVKNRSEYLKQSLFMPPSGFVLAAYARTDRQVGPWRAPAGHQRGIVEAEAVEYSPFQTERDLLLGGNNAVNPIVSFQGGSGFVIYGNETLTRTPKPTDAVHVRRMLIYLKTAAVAATRAIQFEPNDPTTWRNVELALQPLIDFLVASRGVKAINNDGTRPRAKCDSETNPPELQAQKTVNAKLFISHIDAAETLIIDFTLIASGVGTLSV